MTGLLTRDDLIDAAGYTRANAINGRSYTAAQRVLDAARNVPPVLATEAIELLRQLAGEPELVVDGPDGRLPVDPTTAMYLLNRAADLLESRVQPD